MTFGLDSVALLGGTGRAGGSKQSPGTRLDPTRVRHDAVELDPQTMLALTGRRLAGDDRRVLRAFTDQLAVALESRRLSRPPPTRPCSLRPTSSAPLLAAVSHDLRTPLASIKTAVTGLLQDDVALPPDATAELLATIDQQTDRLDRLVGNLLDMTRLQAGALSLHNRPIGVDEVVPAALASLADHGRGVQVEVPETLPRVHADPGLLERAVANVVANALAWSPPDRPVQVTAARSGDRVELQVVDHGPGILPVTATASSSRSSAWATPAAAASDSAGCRPWVPGRHARPDHPRRHPWGWAYHADQPAHR